jgi:hypothetical protein
MRAFGKALWAAIFAKPIEFLAFIVGVATVISLSINSLG